MEHVSQQSQVDVSPRRVFVVAAAMTATVLATSLFTGGSEAAFAHPPPDLAQWAGESTQATGRVPLVRPATPGVPLATPGAAQGPPDRSFGVPAGTRLQPSGDVVVRTAGTVIEGLDVQGCITVLAPSVLIKNTRVRGSCDNLISSRSTGLVVQNVELDGQGDASAQGIGSGGFAASGLDIHGVGDGVRANGDVVLQSSFIHDLATVDGSHNDGVQITEGSNIIIRNNVIENPNPQTSAILVGAHQGSIANVLIEGNLLAGGGYALYGGAEPRSGYTIRDIVLRDNSFDTKFYPKGGRYGAITAIDDPNISVSGNLWQATGQPITN